MSDSPSESREASQSADGGPEAGAVEGVARPVEEETERIEDVGARVGEGEVQFERTGGRTEGACGRSDSGVWGVIADGEKRPDDKDEVPRASIGEEGSGVLIDAGSGE